MLSEPQTTSPAKRAAHRKWYDKNKDMRAAYNKAWRAANPGFAERWGEKNPEKIKVKYLVAKAIKSGGLVKQPCACGNPKSEAHHEDYSKPLDVMWLCHPCHRAVHRIDGRT